MTLEEINIYAIWSALGMAALAALGEWIHARRTSRLSRLAFGTAGRSRTWTKLVPFARVLALAGITWALFTLIAFNGLSRERNRGNTVKRHLMVMLDVSPSMQLADAGEDGNERRAVRAAKVLQSIIDRVPGDDVRFSASSFYTEARMLAKECRDRELIIHFAADVPFHLTYKPGKTDLLKSLNQTGGFMKDWERKSTTLLVISDGDGVAPTGLNPMPSSVSEVIFAGVGDTNRGTFIDGHLSRQDGSSLSQLSRRLGGKYFDANARHIPSEALKKLNTRDPGSSGWKADRRRLALILLGGSVGLLCILPLLLYGWGSSWKPVTQTAGRRLHDKGHVS